MRGRPLGPLTWAAELAGFDVSLSATLPWETRVVLAMLGAASIASAAVAGACASGFGWLAFGSVGQASLAFPLGAILVLNLHRLLVAGIAYPWEAREAVRQWRPQPGPRLIMWVLGFACVQPLVVAATGGSVEGARGALVDVRRIEVEGDRRERMERFTRSIQAAEAEMATVESVRLRRELEAEVLYQRSQLQAEQADRTAEQDLLRYAEHLQDSPLFAFRWRRAWARWWVAMPLSVLLAGVFAGPQVLVFGARRAMHAYLAARHARERPGIVRAWDDSWAEARAELSERKRQYSPHPLLHEPRYSDMPFDTEPRAETLRPREGDPRLADRKAPEELLEVVPLEA